MPLSAVVTTASSFLRTMLQMRYAQCAHAEADL